MSGDGWARHLTPWGSWTGWARSSSSSRRQQQPDGSSSHLPQPARDQHQSLCPWKLRAVATYMFSYVLICSCVLNPAIHHLPVCLMYSKYFNVILSLIRDTFDSNWGGGVVLRICFASLPRRPWIQVVILAHLISYNLLSSELVYILNTPVDIIEQKENSLTAILSGIKM